MAIANDISAPLRHADRFFIGGKWVKPSSDAVIDVIDSTSEQLFFSVAEAREPDMARAVAAARQAFDQGPWPRLSHEQRAEYLRAIATELGEAGPRTWVRSGPASPASSTPSRRAPSPARSGTFNYYAGLAETFPFEEEAQPSMGGKFGLLVREPVGVVGAIIPWNAPLGLITYKIAPALLAGCTVILKASPEAPGEAYVMAEIAEAVGLPAGCAQRRDGRPGGVRAVGPRPPRRQDHLHRVDRSQAGASRRSAGSGSPAAPWSSVASPPPSSSTTWTWPLRPPRWPAPSASSPDRSAPP